MTGPLRADNLPAELNGFVGRRDDAKGLREMLSAARLVTLTGPGGVGKSRLALRVARRVRRAFPDGVWLVELASLVDPELLADTVIAALGMAERSARPAAGPLTAYLEDKRLLLVLDNCEHVAEASAVLVGKLLAAAPRLRVLATSRQSLRVEGEHVFAVKPLSTPPADAPSADVGDFDAVQLFTERARAVAPDFAVTADNRDVVARLCRRLDGLPLAIELAAARLRMLSPGQILERLDDRFRLLTAGPVTAPARQQTLRATLDWSYRLCSAAEQRLWVNVSVFPGTFDLPAAEYVSGDDIDAHKLFDLLAALVDKSIVARASGAGSTARYELLESVRAYAREQLATSAREAALSARHSAYYRLAAVRSWNDFFSPRQVDWFIWLNTEHANLRQALEHCLREPEEPGAALSFLGALHDVWTGTGRHAEEMRWLTRALAMDPLPSRHRAVALARVGYLYATLGDLPTGREMLRQGQVLADQLGDLYARAEATYNLGLTRLYEPNPDLGLAMDGAEEALAQFRAAGDPRRVSTTLMQLATIAAFSDDPRAAAYAEESRALCEAHGARWLKSWALTILSLVRWRQGDRTELPTLLYEALHTKQRLHDPWGAGMCLELLAWNAAAGGHHDGAARLLGACHRLRRLTGSALADRPLFAGYSQECEQSSRLALGDAGYAAAFRQGADLSLDEAIHHALQQESRRGDPVPSAAGGRHPLTRREREIAGLVAQSLSNREIAERLVIAQRTAESHVEHILAKLGFTTRVQIATWVINGGLSEP